MSNQLIPVFQQYFNANGVAEAGLLLHTYITGTLNDKETFQTFGGTANANPIVLDASGYPPAGIYGSGTYRFVLKDSTGTTLKDQDQIILTAGLQPDENGDYIIPDNLDVQGTMTIDDMVITADGTAIWTLNGTEIKRTDSNGNTALNGATIPSDLNSSYQYTFNGNNCLMENKTAGVTIRGNGCYISSSSIIYKAIANSGRFPMITYVSDGALGVAGFTIRQSVVIADSIDKSLGNILVDGSTVTPN